VAHAEILDIGHGYAAARYESGWAWAQGGSSSSRAYERVPKKAAAVDVAAVEIGHKVRKV
jgi:hypothetical protein